MLRISQVLRKRSGGASSPRLVKTDVVVESESTVKADDLDCEATLDLAPALDSETNQE